MAHRSQCSSAGDNPLDPNYLPPHYREEYRLAIDALVEDNLEGYYEFLQQADVVSFLSTPEINYIQCAVQPPKESKHPDQRFLESGGDGSSDTYWPIHSDLDAPGLDLGWPQLHRFIGPTEVTTLVNPAEPNMPTIKEQARRLIKNAQEVVAIVMDMFTDVDIFADILNAAMRNVAVYIVLDEQNAHHFINMVSNCRVNLENIQFLRVRTVSGITYHCRSGNSFKGQMMDRFLLTDCRAVLSGNYSFMWSFEKIHRCLAHLFLGQLVSTFDEEFRILFAQSQPLIIENALAQMEDFSHLPERQYSCDRTPLYRVLRKFPTIDTSHPEEWARHSFHERMDKDWKNRNRHESMHRSLDQGPVDMYNRFPSQQSHMDPSYEQGHSRMPINIMENPAFKRHSYAEGNHGRHSSYQFLQQQEMQNFETHGRQFHKGQHPYLRTGPEADYSGYDKLRDHGYHQVDQYSEPELPQQLEPPDNFDPVLNYLSSTSNVDFDQVSEKLLPAAEGPFGSSRPKKLSLGKTYACQTSPTAPNPTDRKQFFQEPHIDRKDPTVKQGLRNLRINSYLTAFDNAGDEDLPLPHGTDPFEEPPYSLQQTASGTELSVPKFANTREFKIPATPRASQLPNYTKPSVPESSKKLSDDSVNVTAENKTTPTTPSESSSTTEGQRIEEVEPKSTGVQREESFRRKYNAAVQRSSRLRSSLIFSSQLEQHVSQDSQTALGKHDEETGKNEDQWNLPIASQVLSQRRAIAREPFEWSRYVRSATFDNSTTETSKADDVDNQVGVKDSSKENMSNDLPENSDIKESCKLAEIESVKFSPSMPQPKPSQVELPKLNQPSKSLLSNPSHIDMSNPDNRLMFFKELAANRKAAKAAAAEKSTEKALKKTPSELKNNTTLKMEESAVEVSQNLADSSLKKPTTLCETFSKNVTAQDAENVISTEACGSDSLHVDINDKTNKQGSHPKSHSDTSHSCEEERMRVSTDSEKTEPKISPASVSMSVSAGSALSPSQPPEKPKLSNPTVKKKATAQDAENIISTEACESDGLHLDINDKTNKQGSHPKSHSDTSHSCEEEQTRVSTDSEKTEPKISPASVSAGSALSPSQPPEEPKLSNPTVKKKATAQDAENIISTEACESGDLHLDINDKTNKQGSHPKSHSDTSHSCEEERTRVSTDSVKTEPKISPASVSRSVSAGSALSPSQPPEEPKLSNPTVKEKATTQDAEIILSTEACESDGLHLDINDKQGSHPKSHSDTSHSCEEERTRASTDSEKTEPKISPASVSMSVSAGSALSPIQPPEEPKLSNPTVKKKATAQDAGNIISTEACGSGGLHLDINDKTNKQGSHPKSHSNTSHSCEEEQTRASTDSEKTEPKISPASVSMSVSAGSALSPSQLPKEPKLLNPSVKECSPSHPLTVPDADSTVPSVIDSLAQSTDKHGSPLDSTLTASNSLNPNLVELRPSSKFVTLESIQHLGLPQLQSSSSSPPTPSESSTVPHPIGSELISSHPSAPRSSSDHILSDHSSSQDIPFNSSPSPSSSTPHSSPLEFISSNISPEDSSSTPACNILFPKSDKTEPNKSFSPSPSESSQSTNQASQESTLSSITQTVLSPDSTQVEPDSITQSTSSETSSTIGSNISSDTCANDSEPNTSSQSTTKAYCEDPCTLKLGSEKDLPESESNSVPKSDLVESGVSFSVLLASPVDAKVACNVSPSHSSSVSLLTESCLPIVSGLESSNSLPRPDQKDPPKLTPAELPPEHAPTETCAVLNPAIHFDLPSNASPPEPNASHKVALTQVTSSPELTPTGSSAPSPATTVSCSVPLSDLDGSIVSPEAEKTETNTSPTLSPPETSSSLKLTPTDSSKCPISPSIESSSDCSLTDPTSKVIPVPAEPKLPCKTPTKSKSIAPESYPSEPSVPVENNNTDKQCEVSKESEMPDSAGKKKTGDAEATKKVNKTTPQESVCHGKPSDQARENNSSETAEIRERETSDEVVPLTPQSKQSKASHSRYHSSTANVISSSNLRDDTKLLLEQISANSQSRSEPNKESAVTDDDKEDKAEKEAATRSLSKGTRALNAEEREKLLEKIQSMRKERKVYSRFEIAP